MQHWQERPLPQCPRHQDKSNSQPTEQCRGGQLHRCRQIKLREADHHASSQKQPLRQELGVLVNRNRGERMAQSQGFARQIGSHRFSRKIA